jgi:hypothetical protein
MTYGHAERTLATIRLLEAETRDLLCRREQLDPEHAQWLCEAAESASRRLSPVAPEGLPMTRQGPGDQARAGMEETSAA